MEIGAQDASARFPGVMVRLMLETAVDGLAYWKDAFRLTVTATTRQN